MQLSIDPQRTALVLIDLQKGILGMPLAPYVGTQVITNAVSLAHKITDSGGTVVLVHVGFSSDGKDRLKQPVDATSPIASSNMPPDFYEFVPEIAGLKSDAIILKRGWGAFHGTELDLQLRRRGITTIILGGVSTNFGVESTAREAWQHNYSVVVAADACTSSSEEMHHFSIQKIMPRVSRVRSTMEITAAILPTTRTAQ